MGQQQVQQKHQPLDPGKIDFLGPANFLTSLSILLVLLALGLIATRGFNYGIDFSGGTEMEIRFGKTVSDAQMRDFLQKVDQGQASLQSLGGSGTDYVIRLGQVSGSSPTDANATNKQMEAAITAISSGLNSAFPDSQGSVVRVDAVGPQVGAELRRNGVLALFYSLLIILVYVGMRFDFQYAPGAVFCLFHDAILVLGVYSLIGHEISVQTMAAILTVIGYSLNDTIINFDRIRENLHLYKGQTLKAVINRSINDTLSRTLLTAGTTLLSATALFVFADGVIRELALTLSLGIIVGTYSSVYVAAPLVIAMDRFYGRKKVA